MDVDVSPPPDNLQQKGDLPPANNTSACNNKEVLQTAMASTGKIEEITAAKDNYLLRLNKAASRCYQSNGTDEMQGSEFIRVLEDAFIFLKNLHFDEEASECAYEILREAQSLTITDPKGQVLLDMVTLDLPRVILSYMDISEKCGEICENVITHMCEFCTPSEMVSVFCEELSTLCETDEKLSASLYLLHGFSIVIGRIQRRPVENVKVALPIMLAVGKVAASKVSDDDSIDIAAGIFEKLIAIAVSLRGVCKKQVAFVSKDANIAASTDTSRAPASILQLSKILSDCGLSYLCLITGNKEEGVYHLLDNDENDKIVENTSLINIGSILAVLWGYVFVEVATIAHGNIEDLLKKLQSSQSERIRALSNMKYLLSSLDYPWGIKKYSIDFMLAMVDTNSASSKDSDEKIDWSSITPSLFSLSQAVQQIIVYAPDPKQRNEAFSALTNIFAELPTDHKFDILKALIINSNYPSMTALLLGAVRSEIANAFQMTNTAKDEDSYLRSPFQTGDVLELVEFILKPQRGGPPDLPGQSDAVLAALNLYRFLLMIESHGKMNYTGALSKSCLKKAHSEWLLPLRVLVSGIQSENANDYSDFATSTICALNPIELALYHCLELVEECLKHPP